jgi:hypothetical protein
MALPLLACQLLRHTEQRKCWLSYKHGSVSKFWYIYEDGLHRVPYSRVVPCLGVRVLRLRNLLVNSVLLTAVDFPRYHI